MCMYLYVEFPTIVAEVSALSRNELSVELQCTMLVTDGNGGDCDRVDICVNIYVIIHK